MGTAQGEVSREKTRHVPLSNAWSRLITFLHTMYMCSIVACSNFQDVRLFTQNLCWLETNHGKFLRQPVNNAMRSIRSSFHITLHYNLNA